MKENLRKTRVRLNVLGVLIFVCAPLVSWQSIVSTDETPVFASMSRMIWFKGQAGRIFLAMVILFVPTIVSFFLAHTLGQLEKRMKNICRSLLILSCMTLYVGAMELMPGDGISSLSRENIWHGIMSFGGMFLIWISYCLYACFNYRKDSAGSQFMLLLLVFTLITGAFSVSNVCDENSYVVASAVAEIYILTMLSVIGYASYYLAYRKALEKSQTSGMWSE